jgi:hypothetical protein
MGKANRRARDHKAVLLYCCHDDRGLEATMRKSIIVALTLVLSAAIATADAARAEPATVSVKKTVKKKHGATIHRDMVTMKRGTGSTVRRRTTIPSGSLVEPKPILQTNPPAALGTPARPSGAGRSP